MNLEGNTSLALMQAAQEKGADRLQDAKQAAKNKDEEHINAVAKDFEAMFMTEMLKPMFAELKPDERFGGGKGEEIFSGMMLQEYGKMMSETGQLGIADSVKGQLILMQEEADGKRTPLLGKEPMQTTKLNQDQDNSDPLQSIIEEQINAQ